MGKSEKKKKSKKLKSKRKEHKEKHKDKPRKQKKKQSKTKELPKNEEVAPVAVGGAPVDSGSEEDFAIPIALMNSKSHAPETPEEYQRRQSQIRREVDPLTGRVRLIKGDSEVLEEIVSKERQRGINKQATSADGSYYEAQSLSLANKRQQPK